MNNNTDIPWFIADVMLGKLAKWLRLLGFDVIYKNNLDDNHILSIALQEKRVLLTKDKRLYQRACKNNIKAILIESNFVDLQLEQLLTIIDIDKVSPLKRCIRCNSILQNVDKSDIDGLVPEFIFDTINEFFICNKCKKIYWHGSHIKSIDKTINKLLYFRKNPGESPGL